MSTRSGGRAAASSLVHAVTSAAGFSASTAAGASAASAEGGAAFSAGASSETFSSDFASAGGTAPSGAELSGSRSPPAASALLVASPRAAARRMRPMTCARWFQQWKFLSSYSRSRPQRPNSVSSTCRASCTSAPQSSNNFSTTHFRWNQIEYTFIDLRRAFSNNFISSCNTLFAFPSASFPLCKISRRKLQRVGNSGWNCKAFEVMSKVCWL
mmetsp:Transcript_134124/g.388271  ORF Transcript_134124/g.388271 Transcript_134124/m.388271 type:complete len:213 (+) Transcript_134124:847-1485(+)